MTQQSNEQLLNKIEVLQAKFAEEERRNPTPKNIIQLKHLIELLQSNDWERSEHRLFYSNGIDEAPAYEVDPLNGEKYRYFDGFVCQVHKHKFSAITIERSFDFRHRENQPDSILISLDEAVSWQAPELIIQDGKNVIFNGYQEDDFSSDNNLDVLLKDLLTPQIVEAFNLSIDYNLMYQTTFTYIDENIKSETDLHMQLELSVERNPDNPFRLQKVRAVYAGLEDDQAQEFAFLGRRLAHSPHEDKFYELYLSYGGFLIWLDNNDIFIGKDIDDIPIDFNEKTLAHISKCTDDLWIEHAKNGNLI